MRRAGKAASVRDKVDGPTVTGKQKAIRTYSGAWLKRGLAYLFEEDDASYLAVFRILWGSIMAYEAYTYTAYEYGKMFYSFYNSVIQFKYFGFEWCEVPSNPDVLKAAILVMMVAGLFVTLGFLYRLSSVVFFALFTYIYMLEQAFYLNHFYLVSVLSFMMILLPCNCYFSIDAYLWPKIYSRTCPK
jgi:vitamin K-dependent gamma-carboxylase